MWHQILRATGEKIIEIQTLACHCFFTQRSIHFSKVHFFLKRLWFESYFWVIIHKFRASSIFEKYEEKVTVCLIWWLRIIYAWRCFIGHNPRILESLLRFWVEKLVLYSKRFLFMRNFTIMQPNFPKNSKKYRKR